IVVFRMNELPPDFCLQLRKGPKSRQQSSLRWDLVPLKSCSENSQQHRSTSRAQRLENSPPWFCLNWLPSCRPRWPRSPESGTGEVTREQHRAERVGRARGTGCR
uniref:Uncharacterized protein n=1 Tax=Prolemur simus TaxID=1328070 RepID=A0A8C9AR27_PROSS